MKFHEISTGEISRPDFRSSIPRRGICRCFFVAEIEPARGQADHTFDHHIVKLQFACVALEAHFERRPCVEGAIPRWLRGVLRSAVVVFVGVVPEPLP